MYNSSHLRIVNGINGRDYYEVRRFDLFLGRRKQITNRLSNENERPIVLEINRNIRFRVNSRLKTHRLIHNHRTLNGMKSTLLIVCHTGVYRVSARPVYPGTSRGRC